MSNDGFKKEESLNVLGEPLGLCSSEPMTGYFRNGHCDTCANDPGSHTVCCQVTEAFLEYSRFKGNDLSTPRPEFGFQGLKEGDQWCLCASRWLEAYEQGMAPRVNLQSTHKKALDIVPLDYLKAHAVDVH